MARQEAEGGKQTLITAVVLGLRRVQRGAKSVAKAHTHTLTYSGVVKSFCRRCCQQGAFLLLQELSATGPVLLTGQ